MLQTIPLVICDVHLGISNVSPIRTIIHQYKQPSSLPTNAQQLHGNRFHVRQLDDSYVDADKLLDYKHLEFHHVEMTVHCAGFEFLSE